MDTGNECLHTDDEFSILSSQQIQGEINNSFPFDQECNTLNTSGEIFSVPLKVDCSRQNEHLSISHHALGNAYEHMKRKLSELERENKSLRRRLKSSSPAGSLRGMEQLASSQMMSSAHEDEVTKAWEAYSDKCKECEKLRDDLRAAEQQIQKTQNAVRGQSHREDLMRAQSQHDEYRKMLQQSELEIRDHKSKEEMAREELQKEKEFQEQIRLATKERHDEMESTIKAQQVALHEKTRQYQELVQNMDTQLQQAKDKMNKLEAHYKGKLHEIEGKILREREERTLLETHVLELEQYKEDVMRFQRSTGVPLNLTHGQKNETDTDTASNCSDIDPTELLLELRSLTEEINSLKKQTSLQSGVLSRICEDPKIQESLMSLACNGFTELGSNSDDSTPVQCSEQVRTSQSATVLPSVDQRLLVNESPQSSNNFLPPRDATPCMPAFAVSRQIHAVDHPHNPLNNLSSHQIDIPPVPDNVNSAFSNIRNSRTTDDLPHPANTSNQKKSTTLVTMSLVERKRYIVRSLVNEDRPERLAKAAVQECSLPLDFDKCYLKTLELEFLEEERINELANAFDKETEAPLMQTASALQPPTQTNRDSLSSDSGTGSSNNDTLADPISGTNVEATERRLSPDGPNNETALLYYPPRNGTTNRACANAHTEMRAVWPSSGLNLATPNLNALWPPGSAPPGSAPPGSAPPGSAPPGSAPSFEPISRASAASGASSLSREARPQEHGDSALRPNVREFAVQQAIRPISREPPFPSSSNVPPNHPSNRPTNRARRTATVQRSATLSPRRQVDRTSPAFTQEVVDDRAFMPNLSSDLSCCPVCTLAFPSEATPSYMRRHINGHFSEEESTSDS